MMRSLLPHCLLSVAIHAGVIAAIGLNASAPQPVAITGTEVAYVEFVVHENTDSEAAATSPPVPVEAVKPETVPPESRLTERDANTPGTLENRPVSKEGAERTARNRRSEAPSGSRQPSETPNDADTPEDAQPIPVPARASAPKATEAPAAHDSAVSPGEPVIGARVQRLVNPTYPWRARRRGHEGRVVLEAVVSPAGKVLDVHVIEGSGYTELDEAASGALRKSRFVPATRAGQPVEDSARVAIRFDLENSD